MRLSLFGLLALLAVVSATGTSAQPTKKAHQHGIATLGVAVERSRIVITLDSPLDNVLGFERAPRTDEEKQRAAALIAQMKDGAALFRIDPAAGCKFASAEIDAPVIGIGKPAVGAELVAGIGHSLRHRIHRVFHAVELGRETAFVTDGGAEAAFLQQIGRAHV